MSNATNSETVDTAQLTEVADRNIETAVELIKSKTGSGVLLYKKGEDFYALPVGFESLLTEKLDFISKDMFDLLFGWMHTNPSFYELHRGIAAVNNNIVNLTNLLIQGLNLPVEVGISKSSKSGLVLPTGGANFLKK